MNRFLIFLLLLSCCVSLNAQWTSCVGTANLNIQALISNGEVDLAGGATGSYRSTDLGENYSWSNSGNDGNGPTRGYAFDGTYLYTCTSQGVYRSSDNGASWVHKNIGITFGLTSGIIYESPYLFVVGPNGVFKSDNSADSWTTAGLEGVDVRSVTGLNGSIYVGTNGQGIWYSDDWGETWSESNNGLGGASAFRALETKGEILFAGGPIGTGVFRSLDYGASWTLLSGLPVSAYRGFASNEDIIVAGSFGQGVHYSLDDGETWVEINDGLEDLTVFDLSINGEYLIAGTNTKGAFRYPYPGLVHTKQTVNQEKLMVYPNPVEDQLFILSNPIDFSSSYTIKNVAGQVVLEGFLQDDTPAIDVSLLDPGVYVLSLSSTQITATRFIKL